MENILTLFIYWNPAREILPWNIPLLNRPILWYGFFFALGFLLAYKVFQSLLKVFLQPYHISDKEIVKIAEKVSFYVIVGTIVGARLGDVLFYQSWSQIVQHPLDIFKFWEGGLSSHGGVIGIIVSLALLTVRIRKKYPVLKWIALVDLLSIPALLAGAFIRVGNFFNQEILGVPTTLPWGVVFGNPIDGSAIVPRHPSQLYEAIFYFVFFIVLWNLRTNNRKIFILGKTSGLFFIGTFVFRFLIEFLKAHQSALLQSGAALDMGQWLSIPMILVGAVLFFSHQDGLRSRTVKGH
ncbi:MAG: prolipoprotein diacylglyceryl transferase [Verrucomicrobia bacterium]|nr:prolipoprotein diacylglyceryl transferase [Verrucomicrobiota bacterium]